MSRNQHLVGRIVLELDFDDRDDAHPVSDMMQVCLRENMEGILDECLSKIAGPETWISIPKLALDLGELPRNAMEQGFIEKLAEQLALAATSGQAFQLVHSAHDRAFQLISDYADNGQYPWWAGAPSPERLHQAVSSLLDEHPQTLAALMRQQRTRERLLMALPFALSIKIWEKLCRPAQQGNGSAPATDLIAGFFEPIHTWPRAQALGYLERAFEMGLEAQMPAPKSPLLEALCNNWDARNKMLANGHAGIAKDFPQLISKLSWIVWLFQIPADATELLFEACMNWFSNPMQSGKLRLPQFEAWLHRHWGFGDAQTRALIAWLDEFPHQGSFAIAPQPQSKAGPSAVLLAAKKRLHVDFEDENALAQFLANKYRSEKGPIFPDESGLTNYLHALLVIPKGDAQRLSRIILGLPAQPAVAAAPIAFLDFLRTQMAWPDASETMLLQAVSELYHTQFPSPEIVMLKLEILLQSHFGMEAPMAQQAAQWVQSHSRPASSKLPHTAATERGAQENPGIRGPQNRPNSGLGAYLGQIRTYLDMPNAGEAALLSALAMRFFEAANYHEAFEMETWMARECKFGKDTIAALVLAFGQIQAHPETGLTSRSGSGQEEPYFVYNAGLILLWPFYHRFFEQMGWLDGKSFVTEALQETAVLVVQKLAMPEEVVTEAALALPKLLCGLDPSHVVDPGMPLPDGVLEDAEQMLLALLAYWPMAGELSLDGLRQAWINRAGLLRLRDDHWLLRVEQHAQDVLLEGLPWEIGMVMMSWMPRALYVDWAEKARFTR